MGMPGADVRPPARPHPRRMVAAGAGVVGLVAAAAIWSPLGSSLHHVNPVVRPSDEASTTARRQAEYTRAADRTLKNLGEAVMAQDRGTYLAAFDPQATAVRAAEARLLAALRSVPLRSWNYRVVELTSPVGADRPSSLDARVRLTYQLGTNPGVTTRDLEMTLVPGPGAGWRIHRVSLAQGTAPDPWNLGPVTVVNTPRALVLGVGSRAQLQEYARQATSGAGRLDRIWGPRWPRQSVLVVPADQRQLARMLGQADQAGLKQVAAVTTGLAGNDGGATAGQAARMIVNPQAMSQLGPLGHRVIITHELTHLATWDSTAASPPMWLSEGFADYVAYSGTRLGARAVAANSLPRQQVQGLSRLPSDKDFNPRTMSVDGAYAQSWVAADLIARQWSQAKLVQFYRAVAGPSGDRGRRPVEVRQSEAFRTVLGTTSSAFTTLWRSHLERIAR